MLRLKRGFGSSTNLIATHTISIKRYLILSEAIFSIILFTLQFYFCMVSCDDEDQCGTGILLVQIGNVLVPTAWFLCFFIVNMEFRRSMAHSRVIILLWFYQIVISLSWILSASVSYAEIISQGNSKKIGMAIYASYVLINSLCLGLAISLIVMRFKGTYIRRADDIEPRGNALSLIEPLVEDALTVKLNNEIELLDSDDKVLYRGSISFLNKEWQYSFTLKELELNHIRIKEKYNDLFYKKLNFPTQDVKQIESYLKQITVAASLKEETLLLFKLNKENRFQIMSYISNSSLSSRSFASINLDWKEELVEMWSHSIYFKASVKEEHSASINNVSKPMYSINIESRYNISKSLEEIIDLKEKMRRNLNYIQIPICLESNCSDDNPDTCQKIEKFFNEIFNDADYFCEDLSMFFDYCSIFNVRF